MELGILGGAFDPVHSGHVKLAQDGAAMLGLNEVWLIPAHHQPLKHSVCAPPSERLAMCRLAAAGHPGLSVCDIELQREGPSYTVETMDSLVRSHPGTRWTFLAGTDALITLPHWRDPERLVSLCRIIAVERGDVAWKQVTQVLPESLCRVVHLIHTDVLPLSSTDVRRRVRHGESIAGMVPEDVERFIREHNLYKQVSG